MSWAEVHVLDDKLTNLSNATLYINVGTDYANEKVMVKRYDSDYAEVTLDSQGTAEVEVQPKSRYEIVTTDPDNSKTSNVFYVEAGSYKEVGWAADMPDGDTVLPIDDPVVWQKCAGIYELYGYEDLAHIKADSACYLALLASDNANKYLFRSHAVIGASILAFEPICATLGQMPSFIKKLANAPFWNELVYNSLYRTNLYYHTPKGNTGSTSDADGNQWRSTNAYESVSVTGLATIFDGYTMGQNSAHMYTTPNISVGHPYRFDLICTFSENLIPKRIAFSNGRFNPNQGSTMRILGYTMYLYGSKDGGETWEDLGAVTVSPDVEQPYKWFVRDLHENNEAYNAVKLSPNTSNCANENNYYGFSLGEVTIEGVKEVY